VHLGVNGRFMRSRRTLLADVMAAARSERAAWREQFQRAKVDFLYPDAAFATDALFSRTPADRARWCRTAPEALELVRRRRSDARIDRDAVSAAFARSWAIASSDASM
jgi:hypothetical protein